MSSNDSTQEPQDSHTTFENAGRVAGLSLPGEIVAFILENKAWWLIPIAAALSVVGLLVVLGSTGAAPFIYTLF